MFKKFSLGALIALACSPLLFAKPIDTELDAKVLEPSHVTYGYSNYGAESLKSLTASGAVILEGTSVLYDTTISGALKANHVQLNKLTASGSVILDHSIVAGPVVIQGALTSDNTTFMEKVEIASEKINLDNSTLHDITVKENKEALVQALYLSDTDILGSIVFESGNGLVYIDEGSSIHGAVKGGTIIYKDQETN